MMYTSHFSVAGGLIVNLPLPRLPHPWGRGRWAAQAQPPPPHARGHVGGLWLLRSPHPQAPEGAVGGRRIRSHLRPQRPEAWREFLRGPPPPRPERRGGQVPSSVSTLGGPPKWHTLRRSRQGGCAPNQQGRLPPLSHRL